MEHSALTEGKYISALTTLIKRRAVYWKMGAPVRSISIVNFLMSGFYADIQAARS
jgi:hypothetical protein